MHIVGGLYKEVCEFPSWDAEFGSGGRAAAAISAISPGSVLHTYTHAPNGPGITTLRSLGVEVHAQASGSGIVFAYFHPLSDPHVEPAPTSISRLPPLRVSGDIVLRFGMLEGDAIVSAGRAVYDPQTRRNPRPFQENGSFARELALVLNEVEICAMAGCDDTAVAAQRILVNDCAAAIVVKRGTKGAEVYTANGARSYVPAYRSSHVFKIGTGDVFTAIFAHHWAERAKPPEEAADLASRAVAAYCETRALPTREGAGSNMKPVGGAPVGPILLVAASNTLGRRWLAEEARFRLGQLGAEVVDPVSILGIVGRADRTPSAVLALAEGLREEDWRTATTNGAPLVVFAEALAICSAVPDRVSATVTDDFASAAYLALWSASSLVS